MNDFHFGNQADLTISAIPVKVKDAAKNLGVLVINQKLELIGFEEKPDNPTPIPGNDGYCLASMGNYAFKPDALLEELAKDAKKGFTTEKDIIAANPENFSSYDFGYDVIPAMLKVGRRILVYDFSKNYVPSVLQNGSRYWRDIGNLDQFFKANMDVREPLPNLDLYNPEWSVLTFVELPQPAKTVGSGQSLDSICANGVIIINGLVQRSVLSYGVRVNDGAEISDSVLLGYNNIGRAVIKNAIIDRGVSVPDGVVVGVDKSEDLRRGFISNSSNIPVVPKKYNFT